MQSHNQILGGAGKARIFLTAAIAAALAVLGIAGSSKAAETTHTITVDNGRLTMGYVFLNNQILPAAVPGPLNPQLPNTSSSGTIKVEVDGSSARVAEADFDMPIVSIPDPTNNGAPIPMRFGPVGDLNGTWNATTGELSLTGTLQVDVIWGYNDDGAQICRFTAPGITWTTAPNAISPGVAFSGVGGLDGNGALSAFWPSLPSGVAINGETNCNKPNAVVRDPGAVWLSSGITEVPPPPTCQAEGKDGLWPDCEEIEWPEPEPEPAVKITRVKVGQATVKAGKKTKLAIKVTNAGDKKAQKLKVVLKSSQRAVKVAGKVTIDVPAGKTVTVKVPVSATRKAKGKATITAKAAGKSGKGTVTVTKAGKKKRR